MKISCSIIIFLLIISLFSSCAEQESEPKSEYETLVDRMNEIGIYEDYEPPDSVFYVHSLHSESIDVDCRYCHNSSTPAEVMQGKVDYNICKACHQLGTNADLNSVKNIQSLHWSTIHKHNLFKNLDSITFSHKLHVQQQGIDCKSCHGEVEDPAMQLGIDLCVKCHY